MKAVALIPNIARFLAAAALMLVFGTSCQKGHDDNACPHNNTTTTNNGNTRGQEISNGRIAPNPSPSTVNGQIRSGEVLNSGGDDGGGISDDGDDEADKESSNKPRPGQ